MDEYELLIGDYGIIKRSGRHPKAVIGGQVLPYARTNPVNECYVKVLLTLIENL